MKKIILLIVIVAGMVSAQSADPISNVTYRNSYLYGIPISAVGNYNYYVSIRGNDNWNGSRYKPWRTINKAITTIPIAGGKTIGIGDGLYVEGTNRLSCARVFTSQVIISSVSKNANKVTIIGENGGSSGNVIFQTNAKNYKFQYITFSMRVNTDSYALRIASCNNITFYRCKLKVLNKSSQVNSAVFIRPTAAGTTSDILFDECQLSESGTDIAYGITTDLGNITSTINNVQIKNCTGNLTRDNILIDGGTNYLIDGGIFQAQQQHTISFSTDGATSYTTTGIVRNATINNIAGHSLIMGRGCISGAIARNNTIVGGDYGVVVKLNSSVLVELNNITAGSSGGIYVKGAVGATIQDNTVNGVIPGTLVLRAWSDGAGTRFGYLTCQRNNFTGSGSGSKVIEWGDAAQDSGGGVNDYNVYTKLNSAALAAIRGTECSTLLLMQAAWSGYGDGSNDSHSIAN